MLMKDRNIFIILIVSGLLLFSPILSAQETNHTDANGKKQGSFVVKFPSGKIKYTGQFRDNKPFGVFNYYSPDGSLKATNVFSEDGNKARNKQFAENGTIVAEGNFINQLKDSIWRFYSDFDSTLLSEESYRNNLKHGISKTYFPEGGQLSEIQEFKDGIRDGIWKKYFQEGAVMLEANYQNDELEGKFVIYFENGKVKIEGEYLHGVKTGIWFEYNEAGDLVERNDTSIKYD